jgi:hypothetical protein
LNQETRDNLERTVIAFKDALATLDLISPTRNSTQDDRRISSAQRNTTRDSFRGRNNHTTPYSGRSPFQRGGPRGNPRGGRGGGRYHTTRGSFYGRGSLPDDGLLLDKKILDQMTPKQRAAFYQGRDKLRSSPADASLTVDRSMGATTLMSTLIPMDRSISATNLMPPPAYVPAPPVYLPPPPPPPIIQFQPQQTDEESRLSAASSQFGCQGQNRNLQNRYQGAIESSIRHMAVSALSSRTTTNPDHTYHLRARAEIDSRADTTCAGATFVLLEDTKKVCNVGGFHDSMKTIKGVPVGTCATAYDHPELQETIILCFPQALYFGKDMEHSLINPNQLRDYGIRVDSTPKQYEPSSLHAIIAHEEDITIPLKLHGCISYFPTRLPTPRELTECRHVDLSSEAEWHPYSTCFSEQERPFLQRSIGATSTTDRRHETDALALAQRLHISHYVAQHTLGSTSQLAIRHITAPFCSRVRTRQSPLRYPCLNTMLYSDTLFSDTQSLRGNTCAQLFATDKRFLSIYGMKSKGDAGDKLNEFITTTGIPECLVTDGAKEEYHGRWGDVRKKFLLHQRQTEPHSPWQNKAEDEIRETKNHFRHIMDRKKVPEALWDFGMEYTTYVRNCIAHPSLQDRTPYEVLTGDSPDISEILVFGFYDWIKFYEPAPFPQQRETLGRWLGPAHNVGQALCFYILKSNGQIIACSTVCALTDMETHDPTELLSRQDFDNSVKEYIGSFDPTLIADIPIDDLEEPILTSTLQEDEASHANDLSYGPDTLINASIILPRGDRSELGKIKGRKRNNEGLLIGRKHKNPALDSRIYLVEFNDGEQQEISYNILAEHLYTQCDSEGNQYQIFREIINHWKNKKAVDKADQYTTIGYKRSKKKTLAGWDLEVEWKDGSTSWIPLKEIKNTNPVETAEYSDAN